MLVVVDPENEKNLHLGLNSYVSKTLGTLFTKQLAQIPIFWRNFLTSVVWLYVGQIFVSVDHLKPLLMDFKCYYHKFVLNICLVGQF